MKCLLCNLNFLSDEALKTHYIWQHPVNEGDYYFKDLFAPDTNIKSCNNLRTRFQKFKDEKKSHDLASL